MVTCGPARTADTLGGMCRAITCKRCGRPSWAGCGAHVEQVLGHVPKDKRCKCRETTAKASASSGNAQSGFWGRLLGR